MKTILKHYLLLFIILIPISCSSSDSNPHASAKSSFGQWKQINPGLELGRFTLSDKPDDHAIMIHILRIHPKYYHFQLLNASATQEGTKQSAKKWCQTYQLTAAINASMYQRDNKTSVSLMRSGNHINNSYISKDKTFFAFHPMNSSYPPVKMIDRECDDDDEWTHKYHTVIQSIRMISCNGKNVWAKQPERWSIAAIGIDAKNRVLFIHTRYPYSTHDFINTLLSLPIEIKQAMYVEGGPEAQLFIQTNSFSAEFTGGYDADYKGGNTIARPIPNIIGITKKDGVLK